MKTSERLKWIFAALLVLCSIPLLFIDRSNREAGQLWAGFAALCLAGFAFSLSYSAWKTGAIGLRDFDYTRAGQPRRFMATMFMILSAGAGTLITAIWVFFFK